MIKHTLKIVDTCLEELFDATNSELNSAANRGAEAFSAHNYKLASICAQDAMRHQDLLNLLIALKEQWSKLHDLRSFLARSSSEQKYGCIETPSFDSTAERLQKASHELFKALLKSGARAFSTGDFDTAQTVCKYAKALQSFNENLNSAVCELQKNVHTTCGKAPALGETGFPNDLIELDPKLELAISASTV